MSTRGPLQDHAADLHELSLIESSRSPTSVSGSATRPIRRRTGTAALAHGACVHETVSRRLPIWEQVGEDGAVGEEAQLLVHDADARAPRVLGRRERDLLPVDRDRAGVRLAPHRPGSS